MVAESLAIRYTLSIILCLPTLWGLCPMCLWAQADYQKTVQPIVAKNCVSCHLPKIEVPGTHFKFTDHRIRIVRDGEPFPN